ncbi:hypothetical protein KDX16_27290 [Burkholderia vietnamiensis]|nr:hypothetical protein [Burkholderia vietnamiensis]MBR7919502.1 hypothetical protein [Burkholderia vietnamiensis]
MAPRALALIASAGQLRRRAVRHARLMEPFNVDSVAELLRLAPSEKPT